jgi:hypothetical protein
MRKLETTMDMLAVACGFCLPVSKDRDTNTGAGGEE